MIRLINAALVLAFALMSPTHARAAAPSLASTPPMGWISWNCFEKEIDEEEIWAIADAMVRAGMREAGYVYLVLDDAWMSSVYHCAGTSSHDRAIHPAYNGLWQFAGPGHWNDPDMLQVANLKDIPDDRNWVCDRTHFGLWCILAAPLMAGNDLRTMNKDVQCVLTAPELIAVNQDPRGVQGYKIFDRDGCEIDNKPLADGTTAEIKSQ